MLSVTVDPAYLHWIGSGNKLQAGKSPDEVTEFLFNLLNPSSRSMGLGFTQPLTKISIRKCFWGGERGRHVRLKISPSVSRLFRASQYEIFDISQCGIHGLLREQLYFYLFFLVRKWFMLVIGRWLWYGNLRYHLQVRRNRKVNTSLKLKEKRGLPIISSHYLHTRIQPVP
jgi:hypothetical protein